MKKSYEQKTTEKIISATIKNAIFAVTAMLVLTALYSGYKANFNLFVAYKDMFGENMTLFAELNYWIFVTIAGVLITSIQIARKMKSKFPDRRRIKERAELVIIVCTLPCHIIMIGFFYWYLANSNISPFKTLMFYTMTITWMVNTIATCKIWINIEKYYNNKMK